MKFSTKLIHTGHDTDPYTGAASIPIYHASTYHQEDVDQIGPYEYARSGNPTRKALEETIAYLENGKYGYAFSSGMAAISSVLLIFSQGDHLIVPEDVYGGTYRMLTSVLNRFGIEHTFVDTTDLDAIRKAVRPETRGLYLETPSNPTLEVTDLRGAVAIAKEHNLITMIDNTFMTPYYQNPLDLGVDIVIHSATKFLGGHSDVLAGLVALSDEKLAARVELIQKAFGAVLGVQDCWILLRGIKTLQARMDRSTESAQKIAEFLRNHPAVENVFYTGLSDHPGHALHESQASGHGAVLSFDVGSGERAREVLKKVKFPLVAVSLGGVESILSYPALMSHKAMPREVRLERGITDGLLRFSVGLEDVDDLIADLDQALL